MKGTIKAALLALAVIAYAAPAYAVPGVDFFGYFRDGFATNSKGGGQTCFKTPTMDYKLRLGNECDNYGEWGIQANLPATAFKTGDTTAGKTPDDNGVVFSAGVMFNYDQQVAQHTGNSTAFGIQQNYFKAMFPKWNGITFWGGKQYYERENINMIDFFYLNTSDTGIGFENLDTGFGKLSFSIFGYQPVAGTPAKNGGADIAGFRPEVRLQGLPLGGFGTLTVDANVIFVSRNTTALGSRPSNESDSGWWFTLEWFSPTFLGLSANTLTFQWANAVNSGMGNITGVDYTGFTTPLAEGSSDPLDKNNQQLRVLDWLMIAPNAQFQVGVGGMYQSKTWGNPGASNVTSQQYGLFASPMYWFADYFKIQGDIGYTANTYSNSPVYTSAAGSQNANLTKFTIVPTLAPKVGDGQNGFFVRPEFRIFYTYGSWSGGANKQNPPTGASTLTNFGSATSPATSGSTFGAQVEGWF